MSEKPYRGILADSSGYYLGEHSWKFKEVAGTKLVEWRKKMESMEDDSISGIKSQSIEAELTKEIFEQGLEGANYEKLLDTFHPRELSGAAGDVYAFLYEYGTVRERQLLSARSKLEEQMMNRQGKSS